MAAAFPTSYVAAREQFRAAAVQLQARWPSARLEAHPLDGYPDLTVDWLSAAPVVACKQLLVVTTGVHGIEGYVGAAILQLLIEDVLPRLDPRTTGLLLIHALNPWGMAQRQRTNAVNVDLNRNFVADGCYDPAFNADYDELYDVFNPRGPVRRRDLGLARFTLSLAGPLRRFSAVRVQEALLIGQYRHADGLYYGGVALQEESRLLLNLWRAELGGYERAVYLDMHTGYGPCDQMTVVNSPQEPRSNHELAAQFGYPLVVRTEPGAFYAIRGDVVDGLYSLAREAFPRTHFYGGTFEFGTLGDSLLNKIRSMQTMVLANQLRHHGAKDAAVREVVLRRFEALYVPEALAWREKALADARRAFEGVLRAEGFLEAR